jgi:hypothetical protein
MKEALELALVTLECHPLWLAYGFVSEADLLTQFETFQKSEDKNTEHYRYAMFLHFLASHKEIDDTTFARYLELAGRDVDPSMARSVLMALRDRGTLTAEQIALLHAHPLFGEERYQAILRGRDLADRLRTETMNPALFEKCFEGEGLKFQRQLLDRDDLTPEQVSILAERGGTRAVRNIAGQRLKQRK